MTIDLYGFGPALAAGALMTVKLALSALCLGLVLRFASVIHRILRDSGVTLMTRIAGLLLSAIAVQLIADAVRAFVDGTGNA